MTDECPKGGEHRIKWNSGDPLCIKCGERPEGEGGSLKLPATLNKDGTLTVHWPGQAGGGTDGNG